MNSIRYQRARAFADRYMPDVQAALGRYFFRETDRITDMTEATDLSVLALSPGKIAVRVRRMSQFDRYGGEFTVRAAAYGGHKSELEKFLDGYCDYGFYGWVAPDGLKYWTIYDLEVFRAAVRSEPLLLTRTAYNPSDGITFNVFRWVDFPASMILETTLPGLQTDPVTGDLYWERAA